MERDQIVSEPDEPEPEKRRWWPWVVGGLLLLAFCDDDDDDRPRQYCYTFSNGESSERRLCFDEPLPESQYCYMVSEDAVQCYAEPQQ